jgi:catechol 2,3-dioxygenase-like lactoylglutathione lyase family enzyme
VNPRVSVIGLDHVQLSMPPGRERDARRFYVDVLGLREVDKPGQLGPRGGCWFVAPGIAVHLGIDQRFIAARKAHPALVVTDLAAARESLAAAGAPIYEDDSGLTVKRFYTEDPFGNRIELIDPRDAGFSDRANRTRDEVG